jgi:hypothetical protein
VSALLLGRSNFDKSTMHQLVPASALLLQMLATAGSSETPTLSVVGAAVDIDLMNLVNRIGAALLNLSQE